MPPSRRCGATTTACGPASPRARRAGARCSGRRRIRPASPNCRRPAARPPSRRRPRRSRPGSASTRRAPSSPPSSTAPGRATAAPRRPPSRRRCGLLGHPPGGSRSGLRRGARRPRPAPAGEDPFPPRPCRGPWRRSPRGSTGPAACAPGAGSPRCRSPRRLPPGRRHARPEGPLPRALTASLMAEANRAYGTNPEDLLLAALAVALERQDGTARTLVTLEGHGREYRPADLLGESAPATGGRSAGSRCSPAGAPRRRRPRRHDPHRQGRAPARADHGFTWGLMQALPEAPRLRPAVSFNYLGQMGAEARRGGRFAVDWDAPLAPSIPPRPGRTPPTSCAWWSTASWRSASTSTAPDLRDRAEALLAAYRAAIEAVVAHCLSRGAAEVTPSRPDLRGAVPRRPRPAARRMIRAAPPIRCARRPAA